jgi:hypothetical protein
MSESIAVQIQSEIDTKREELTKKQEDIDSLKRQLLKIRLDAAVKECSHAVLVKALWGGGNIHRYGIKTDALKFHLEYVIAGAMDVTVPTSQRLFMTWQGKFHIPYDKLHSIISEHYHTYGRPFDMIVSNIQIVHLVPFVQFEFKGHKEMNE